MRERLTGGLIIGYILIMIAFSFITLNSANGQQVQKRIEKLPAFSYYTLEGKKFTHNDLDASRRVMLVYFNPACEVCQAETEEIVHNMEYFKDIQIVMISPSTKDEIVKFSSHYNLANFKQVVILQDVDDTFYREFNAMGYPALYMYDQKKNLLGYFNGHAAIDEIKDVFGPNMAKK